MDFGWKFLDTVLFGVDGERQKALLKKTERADNMHEDRVQSGNQNEKRSIRVSIRIYPSQNEAFVEAGKMLKMDVGRLIGLEGVPVIIKNMRGMLNRKKKKVD